MLVLFDIDGTMLSSEGIGVRSINEAVSALHGVDCTLEGIPVGGRLDPLIWDDIARNTTSRAQKNVMMIFARSIQKLY